MSCKPSFDGSTVSSVTGCKARRITESAHPERIGYSRVHERHTALRAPMTPTSPPGPAPAVSPLDISPWVKRWSQALRPGATALDLACGSGRHLRHLAAAGMAVTGVDRDEAAVAALRPLAEIIVADIEGQVWPLAGRRFDLVVVTNYLWRPLLPLIVDAVAPGGWLLYETFADGQQTIGRPARPDFLLQPGELLDVCRGRLRVIGYEDGFDPSGVNGRYVQRVAAVRPAGDAGIYQRHRLD